ncbi:hypothetical protein BT96DRAFT_999619 [Gymnopus androsaceus JB14]|uniref:Uncharacterized protein n=1 Tax=Gymnopus androsaceus JB14 TaxID=1447944 RepID=A0A6A4H632_9AGAR|nr:hypothetical protein BT96DRAFT_999619 [Gymnopus androsaceus JB14]
MSDLINMDPALLTPAQCASAAEQRLLAVAFTLKTAQQLEKAMKAEKYTIPESLRKSLHTYSMLFLLSPHLSSFRGRVADAVINAMRELGFEGIPARHEIGNIDVVRAFINEKLTQDHYTIKKKLDGSVKPNSATANIGNLAHALCSKFNVPMTVELLARIALLRWSLGQHPDDEAEQFWLHVDHDIDEYRRSGGFKSPDTAGMNFRYLYDEDVKKYGDPTTTSVIIVPTSSITDNQYTIISKWAKTVNPPDDKKSNKRQRMDDGEDEVGGGGEPGSSGDGSNNGITE